MSHQMYETNPDGRKRKRLTPINVTTAKRADIEQADHEKGDTLDAVPQAKPGAWNHLARWDTANDTVIEFGNDNREYFTDVSDGTPGPTEGSDDDGEGDNLLVEQPTKKLSKLSASDIADAINACIERYENEWRPGKDETQYISEEGQTEGPVLYDPLMMWEEAEAAGQRETLAQEYELEAEYYSIRLNKLCHEIAKDPGDSLSGVRKNCRNLRVTVELMRRAYWLEDIYRLSPDTGDDEEGHSEASEPSGAPKPTDQSSQQCSPPSRVIDLGTPSHSEDEGVFSDLVPEILIRLKQSGSQERSTQAHALTPDPTIVDTVELAGSFPTSTSGSTRSDALLGDTPEHASILTVSQWSWALLEDTQDRKRAVSKAIHGLGSLHRERIRERLRLVGRAHMIREIPACIDMLLHDQKRMPGILPQDLPKIQSFTKLYICWFLCGNYIAKRVSDVDLMELASCLREDLSDPSTFCDYVDTVFHTTFSQEALSSPAKPSQAEIIEISDDDDEASTQLLRRRTDADQFGSIKKSTATVVD